MDNSRRSFLRNSGLGLGAGLVGLGSTHDQQAHGQNSSMSFWDLILKRRSKRFAKGMKTYQGPLAFESMHLRQPLNPDQEDCIAFAGSGITGYARGDLIYTKKDDGQMMAGFVGRTVPSADACCSIALFAINDDTTRLIKRPNELSTGQIEYCVEQAKLKNFSAAMAPLWQTVKNSRSQPPLEAPYNFPVNKWDLYQPGTSYFLPVVDTTYAYINGLLSYLSENVGTYIVDERRGFKPAGLKQFARSRGGHLYDDMRDGRTITIDRVENLVDAQLSVELGTMVQNLILGSEALGLGAFPNWAAHPFGWFKAIGYKMGSQKPADYLGLKKLDPKRIILDNMGLDPIPYPLSLSINGSPVMKPYLRETFGSVRKAVYAVLNRKYGPNGVYGSRIESSAFARPEQISNEVRNKLMPAQHVIEAVIAYMEYIYGTYGRFPAYSPAFRTNLGVQVANLDPDFYATHYRQGS